MRSPALLLACLASAVAIYLGYQQYWAPGANPPLLPDSLVVSGTTASGQGQLTQRAVEGGTILAQAPATGTGGTMPMPPVAPAAPAPVPPAQPPAAAGANGAPLVDESALRYFARQGDQRRLAAEIARLKALYPGWTPPTNPLDAPAGTDPELDRMWALYAENKLAEVRKAIADRQAAEPDWVVPDDLLQRLALAESRERLINASNLKQYETVIRVASTNPSLLTCSEVDVLWRVAEAFAKTGRQQRAEDAYRYVLTNCDNAGERLATMQKAMVVMPRASMNALLETARSKAEGDAEFQTIQQELARQALIAAAKDPKITVAQSDVDMVGELARTENKATDSLLLGWYFLGRNNVPQAEEWFRKARGIEDSSSASQGLALALIAQKNPAEAEDVMVKWRDEFDESRSTYLAAAANLLATDPPVEIAPDVLQRIVPAVVAAKDTATAQQLGWYAYLLNQFDTAAQWFEQALEWKPDDEPSAYGLALTSNRLGDKATVAAIQRRWVGKSTRIATLGESREARRLRQLQERQKRLAPVLGQQQPAPAVELPVDRPKPPSPLSPELYPSNPLPQIQPQLYQAETLPQPQFQAQPLLNRDQPAAQRFPAVAEPEPVIEPALPEATIQAQLNDAPPARSAPRASGTPRASGRGCTSSVNPETLSGQAALTRGWCLMDINRPLEAAAAFEAALRSGSERVRSDAAYGQSLAYLRAGLSNQAAVAASKSPQDHRRAIELQTSILERQATGAFDAHRYVEALLALDQRDAIAPQRNDLMVMRGYAYLNLGRWGDAERVFRAVAKTGNRDAARGLAELKSARHPRNN